MSAWLDERARELRASVAAISKLRDELSYLQIGWRPPDGGWSIGQVFEHLIITDTAYLPRMRDMVEDGARGSSDYKPTFAARMLIRSLQPTSVRRLTAPRIWRPGPEPRAHVIDEYLEVRQEVVRLVQRVGDADIRRNRMTSPASRLFRVTLGDAIVLLIVHTQRHLRQVERIRAYPAFPSA